MVPFGSKLPNNTSKISRHRSKLAFETLERREMLAANMAEIVGVVRTDLQGDGDAGNDVVVAGALATLYRDGGDGVFGGDDTVIGSPAATNADGRYRFDQVGAGKYFIQISLPSNLQFRPGEDIKELVISADEGDGITGPTIDGFTTLQIAEASPPLPSSAPSQLTDPNVLGGERDMWVELTQSTNPISSVALASSGGNLYLASGPGTTGNAKVIWDGPDASAQIVNPIGLGGIDLTQFSGNTMTGIALTSGADHPNATITMRIYTDGNNWSEFTTTVPESPGGAATGQATFNFDDVPTASAGQGADFTNVGALELTFEGVSAVDGQVALIGLVGRATKRLDFTAEPRLSLGDHVWADADDDGIHQASEPGIEGVKLNLFEDTNADNSYTQGVDALLGMTTTNANGDYLFADLFPGKYLVQVDPMNFLSTGPLAGLRSSTGNDPAPDPDNNVNGDDNGTGTAGAGVLSQSVMLSGNSEPTNDGDSNSNSNLTVDFGFFGFDLVLDKAVQQMTVAPAETLNYTVKINNDGPSDAANTTFEDTLPDAVTFVSASATLNGSALDAGFLHAGGVVTADLGTMRSGDVVIITILATVNDDATGTLVNTATVAAPKEVDLSNNTDTVSNPTSPRIDLAITKTDSRDPVDPGSTFSYTLDIVNNGPSDATGVIVTDNLPDTGVTFQGASQTPASVSGDQLVFNVGDLASGASTSITIDVRVDEDFVGELLNHTEVRGNETETTLANNEATEPTIVRPRIDLAITKTDSRDPVSAGSTFSYTLNIVNNGPSNATGVVVTDNLPVAGVMYQSASRTPDSVSGDQLVFNIGDLASGESTSITIDVRVDEGFAGELLNQTEVRGNEAETTLANNQDTEPTRVKIDPASLAGSVFVDRNDNGEFDSGETPLGGIVVSLKGIDITGATVVRTTTTASDGSYLFDNLTPGTYRLVQTQPTRYDDGKDHIGTNGGAHGSDPGPLLIPNDVDPDQIQDLFMDIQLSSGDAAVDYDFGELAVHFSKIDFIGSANW